MGSFLVVALALLESHICCARALRTSRSLRASGEAGSAAYDFAVDENYVEDFWELKDNIVNTSSLGSIVRAKAPDNWHCDRSQHIHPSPEDVHMGLNTCPDKHVLGMNEFSSILGGAHCQQQLNKFGKYMTVNGKKFMYVEILKCGSRTFESMFDDADIQDMGVKAHDAKSHRNVPRFRSERDVADIYSFAMVRHPVTRFISAYGTIMHRIGGVVLPCMHPELRQLTVMEEPGRFNAFVDMYIRNGTDMISSYSCGAERLDQCVIGHAFSQTWFMNFWPGPITQLMHSETLEKDVTVLSEAMGKPLVIGHHNEHEGTSRSDSDQTRNLLLSQKETIQKLHDYLRSEIVQFGYSPLSGWE